MGKELIEKVFQKFEDHLSIENNNRIIFSGKFGIGKSYFFSEFFKEQKYEDKYFPIFLNPVNYSVSSNQDIFELIKFDILFQILDKNSVDFESFDFHTGNLVYQYFSNKFLNDFISNVDLLGETIVEEQIPKSYSILKKLGKLISKISEINKDDFEKFKKEIEANPDLRIIKKFFDKEEIKVGSIYENNAVSQLIYQLISNINTKTGKETILIIDDLDRIDPEHIFRILNIFSAHDKLGENKFGFEKVILVCDINNIKHIYHHFYGEKVDFFGYINKFYSIAPYEYKNENYSIIFKSKYNSEKFIDLEEIRLLGFLFSDAISKHFITIRQLFGVDFSKKSISKYYETVIRYSVFASYDGVRISNFHQHVQTYALFETAINYFGSTSNFIK